MENQDFITTEQAQALLGVSRPTFHRLLKEFEVTPYTRPGIGNKNFFKKSDIERIKQERSQFRPKTLALVPSN